MFYLYQNLPNSVVFGHLPNHLKRLIDIPQSRRCFSVGARMAWRRISDSRLDPADSGSDLLFIHTAAHPADARATSQNPELHNWRVADALIELIRLAQSMVRFQIFACHSLSCIAPFVGVRLSKHNAMLPNCKSLLKRILKPLQQVPFTRVPRHERSAKICPGTCVFSPLTNGFCGFAA